MGSADYTQHTIAVKAGGPLKLGDVVMISHFERRKWWQFWKPEQIAVVLFAGGNVKERL